MITTLPYAEQTEILAAEQCLDQLALDAIAESRIALSEVLNGQKPGIIASIGPCALTNEVDIIQHESQVLSDAGLATSGLLVVRRLNPWKPRTNPNDWFGEETTNPRGAYKTLVNQARSHANLFIELARQDQADRYAHMLSGIWFGSRNGNINAKIAIAEAHPNLPIAIKNPLDGNIEPTMAEVKKLREVRGNGGAPVVLMYRGGTNAQNPRSWSEQYKQALDLTDGQMFVDTAHGGEQAHDIYKGYRKSELGQILCLEHVLKIARSGQHPLPKGIIMEASKLKSPTDPNMDLGCAISGSQQLARIALHQQGDTRV